ncbi:MAG: YccF domain-containing protein [Cyclobacteriaceae bacterium]|nr:YccF domain-containing protein [Cyclobacteriaceae bacterium]
MRLTGNIIWFFLGGVFIFLEYLTAGLALCLTIIGIPFGFQCFKLAFAHLAPFGKEVVPITPPSGFINTFFNVIWVIFAGIWIALTHIFWGLILCLSIVGIPFGLQHFKLMPLCFAPFGQDLR